jgi:hypothetical protein
MRAFTVWIIVWIAFTLQAFAVHYLPFPPWGKLLVAVIYGGVVGWGIIRWKSR